MTPEKKKSPGTTTSKSKNSPDSSPATPNFAQLKGPSDKSNIQQGPELRLTNMNSSSESHDVQGSSVANNNVTLGEITGPSNTDSNMSPNNRDTTCDDIIENPSNSNINME